MPIKKLFGKKTPQSESKALQTHKTVDNKRAQPQPGQFAVLPASELLTMGDRPAVINNIQNITTMPEKHYKALVYKALENVATFVQQLPVTERHHHSVPGGLLDHCLEVIHLALLIRRGFMLPIGAPPEVLSKKQEIWTYATITASLMKTLGPAIIQQRVNLYDKKGELVKVWQPYRETMEGYSFYDIRFEKSIDNGLGARMTPLLARSIIPEAGINWLFTDRDIINQWLACLSGDMAAAGILGQMVDRANKENIMKHSHKAGIGQPVPTQPAMPPPQAAGEALPSNAGAPSLDAPSGGERALPSAGEGEGKIDLAKLAALKAQAEQMRDEAPPKPPESRKPPRRPSFLDEDRADPNYGREEMPPRPPKPPIHDPTNPFADIMDDDKEEETVEAKKIDENKVVLPLGEIPSDIGEFFVFWLRAALDQKKVTINQPDSLIHMVKEGMLLVSPGIFHRFVSDNSDIDTQADTVQKRFQKMKLHKKNGPANMINYSTMDQGKRKVIKGYVIVDVDSLVSKDKLPGKINSSLERDYI